MGGMGPLPV